MCQKGRVKRKQNGGRKKETDEKRKSDEWIVCLRGKKEAMRK